MKPTIEIVIELDGEVNIDAIGFKGPACEVTKVFAEALGVITKSVRKPEYYQTAQTVAKQKVGS